MSAQSRGGTAGTKRVFLHIGAPKTGTTYLQHVLFKNREALADAGVLYPYSALDQTFRSAHDFCGTTWFGHHADRFRGEWDRVAELARSWEGSTVIISSELLAAATPDRIKSRLGMLAPAQAEQTELHVVFSARDLARQLVSDWQEQVKHKHTVTLERFVDDLVELGRNAPEPFGRLFWGLHDAGAVLATWSEAVPPERIHVITVPPPGGPSDALWTRFCTVTGLDPAGYDTTAKRSNASMGVEETELVRRMNRRLTKMDGNSYDVLVRLFLADKVLGGGTTRLTLPPDRMAWARSRSQTLIDQLSEAGYQVEGDLSDLMPRPPETDYVSPTALTDGDLGPVAIKTATALLKHAGKMRVQNLKLKAVYDGGEPPSQGRRRPLRPRALGAAVRRRLARSTEDS
jgi:hypothetical protein